MDSFSSLNVAIRVKPDYVHELHVDTFSSVDVYNAWVENTLNRHATFRINQKTKNAFNEIVHYHRCDHSFNPRIVKNENIVSAKKKNK